MYKIIFSKISDLSFARIYFSIEANTKSPDWAASVIPNSKTTEVSERG